MNKQLLVFMLITVITLFLFNVYSTFSKSNLNSAKIQSLKKLNLNFNESLISANQSVSSIQLTVDHDIDDVPINTITQPNTSSPRVFCMILTSNRYFNLRAKAIYETWATKCDEFKFIMKIPEKFNESKGNPIKLSDILDPPGLQNDIYKKLTDKMFCTLKYLYTQTENHYDFYLKADDDSFVFVDNLRWFLHDKNSSEPVTYGYDFRVLVPGGFHSGGGSYLLSKEALKRIGEKLNANYSSCVNTGTEDVGKMRERNA